MIIQTINFGNQSRVRCGISDPTHNYGAHIHESSEILYVLEGSIESTVDGKTDLLCAGDVAVITPFKVHSTNTPDRCRLCVCVVTNDFMTDLIPQDELFSGYQSSAFTPSQTLGAYLKDKFPTAAVEAFQTGAREAMVTTKVCVHAIIEEFLRIAKPGTRTRYQNVLANVILYLNEHYKENITLKSTSKALGYTSNYISHCLEELPQMNFSMILNSIRIEYAKKLLLSEKKSNIDIAYECGYFCERSFYRAFYRIVGMTPKDYVRARK